MKFKSRANPANHFRARPTFAAPVIGATRSLRADPNFTVDDRGDDDGFRASVLVSDRF